MTQRSSSGEQPFVDGEQHSSIADMLGRVLEHVAPDSYVAGGSSDDVQFKQRPRNYELLKQRERIYTAGGPITDFIDTRAVMTYGTGVEFQTDETELTDGQGRSVDEWLEAQFPLIDQAMISRGIHTYVYGDSWPELVVTRGGDVSHINLVHPTTVNPKWDAHGKIQALEQLVKTQRGKILRQPMDLERHGHWYYKNESAGPLGDSLIAQNRQEIEWYHRNQEQRANAIRLHGSPKYHIQVGSESQSIPDRLIRRVRDRFQSRNIDEKTSWTTGGQIEVDELDAPGFEGMDSITETDVTKLASGFGVPLEWTNFGSAGLGEGTPAESRIQKFERQARGEQRRAAEQFKQFPLRLIVDEFSPFPRGTQFDIEFGDPVTDRLKIAQWLEPFAEHYTRDEIRGKLGDAPLTDEQRQQIEDRVEQEEPAEGGGLFAAADGTIDAPDPLDEQTKRAHTDGGVSAQNNSGGSGNDNCRALLHGEADADALTQEELVWQDIYENVLWPEEVPDRHLFEFDPEDVPNFVIESLRDAIASNAVFDNFETIGAAAASKLEDTLLESLSQPQGWSVTSLAEDVQDVAVQDLTTPEAERIARTETQSLVNTAREDGYAEQFDLDEERFDWVGPNDTRNSDVCPAIKAEVPEEGLVLDELQALVVEMAREFGHDPRRWTPHISCRHTFTRQVQ